MIRASDVRHKLALLAEGKLSLNAFENWLAPYIWNMEQDSSAEAVDLVYSLQLLFAERDNRRLSAASLRGELVLLLNNISDSVVVDSDAPSMPYVKSHSAYPAFWIQPSPVVLQLS